MVKIVDSPSKCTRMSISTIAVVLPLRRERLLKLSIWRWLMRLNCLSTDSGLEQKLWNALSDLETAEKNKRRRRCLDGSRSVCDMKVDESRQGGFRLMKDRLLLLLPWLQEAFDLAPVKYVKGEAIPKTEIALTWSVVEVSVLASAIAS